jgi:transcriptional regulator with XRE-family HTH domain
MFTMQGKRTKDVVRRFGKRIRDLRLERSMSQEDVSQKTGIGRAGISRMEGGKAESCLGTMQALADTFGIRLSDLLKDV